MIVELISGAMVIAGAALILIGVIGLALTQAEEKGMTAEAGTSSVWSEGQTPSPKGMATHTPDGMALVKTKGDGA